MIPLFLTNLTSKKLLFQKTKENKKLLLSSPIVINNTKSNTNFFMKKIMNL